MSEDLRRVAEWVFKRLGRRGDLHPGALAIALGMHFVPVNAPGARTVGTRIEYEYAAPATRKRWLVMRECAREILRLRGATPDDASADVLAMLFSVPGASTSSSARLVLVHGGGEPSRDHRGSVVKAGTSRRCSTRPRAQTVL
jgi:hypothetical protein